MKIEFENAGALVYLMGEFANIIRNTEKNSGNHSSDEFTRCMNEITKLLVSYNMNFEETCAVFDTIKSKLDIGQIPVKTILDYC